MTRAPLLRPERGGLCVSSPSSAVAAAASTSRGRPVHRGAVPAAVTLRMGTSRTTLAGMRLAATFGGSEPVDEESVWASAAFPFYLQNGENGRKVCEELAAAQQHSDSTLHAPKKRGKNGTPEDACLDLIWSAIRREAAAETASEPLLSSFLYASILAHDSFERSLAFVLANRLANAVLLPTQLFEVFLLVISVEPEVRRGAVADLEACRERDPACQSLCQALLHFKGFHAVQIYRIAHALWHKGQEVMALTLQSRMSEVFAVDIHPAARMGRGILIDHGTGVVIGETAVVGDSVSLLQNVTLGGTGKEVGDRHPKVSNNVLIGASATILGNIVIGEGAQIAAGSLVLQPVEAHTMVAGSPAKEVGRVSGNPALKMQHWNKKLVEFDPFEAGEGSNGTKPAVAEESRNSRPKGGIGVQDGSRDALSKSKKAGDSSIQKSKAKPSETMNLESGSSSTSRSVKLSKKPDVQNGEPNGGPVGATKAGSSDAQQQVEDGVDSTHDDAAAAERWPLPTEPEYVI